MTKKVVAIVISYFLLMPVTAGAATWSSLIQVSWSSTHYRYPKIAVDASKIIHIVWEDFSDHDEEIKYKNSIDGGSSWSTTTRLTWNDNDSNDPDIAVDSNDYIHVVWSDESYGNEEILYKKSTDTGTTWTAVSRLTWNSGDSSQPAVAIDSNDNIHVVWIDQSFGPREVLYKKSTDSGSTWSAVNRLTWSSGYSYSPDVTVDSNNRVCVVWDEGSLSTAYQIYFKRSPDAGSTWLSRTPITWDFTDSKRPAIAVNGAKFLFLVWNDSLFGNNEIHFKKSSDHGLSWSPVARITFTTGESGYPRIAADANNIIHVVWEDDTSGNYEIYYKSYTISSSTWSSATRLTWNSSDSRKPDITVDDEDNIYIVYHDDKSAGIYQIYLKIGT